LTDIGLSDAGEERSQNRLSALSAWARRIVAELIEERFGVQLDVTAIGRLLAELDITPQNPLRRAYESDPVAIERWTREEYRLRARAKPIVAKSKRTSASLEGKRATLARRPAPPTTSRPSSRASATRW
jgi:hypothetical protein